MTGWLIEGVVAGSVLAVLTAAACKAFHPVPAVRHLLWLIVLVKLLLPPIFLSPLAVSGLPGVARLPDLAPSPAPAVRSEAEPRSDSTFTVSDPDGATPADFGRPVEGPLPSSLEAEAAAVATRRSLSTILAAIWAAGALLFAGIEASRLVHLLRAAARARPVPGTWRSAAEEIAGKLGVRPPDILASDRISSPIVWSLRRPKVLIPAGLLDRLSAEGRQAAIAHELAHLRRRDHWIGWLELAVSIAWWWNPISRLVRRKLRESAELACDAWVVWMLPGIRRTYAETIVEVCNLSSFRAPAPVLAMRSRAGKVLKERVKMIFLDRARPRASVPGLVAAGLAALLSLPGWTSCRGPGEEVGASSASQAGAAPQAASPASPAPPVAVTAESPGPVANPPAAAPEPAPRPTAPAAEAPEPAEAAPAQPAAVPSAEKPVDCAKAIEEIRKIFAGIPEDYRDAKDLDKLRRDVKDCRARCEAFIASCPWEPGLEEVQYDLARLLFSLSGIEWVEFVNLKTKEGIPNSQIVRMRPEWAKGYYGRIAELASAALAKAEKSSAFRGKCLDVLGDAFKEAGDAAKALQYYEELLREYPGWENKATTYLAIARTLQDLGRYSDGIAVVRKAMAELPKDASFPFFYETLFQLDSWAGNLPALLKVVEEMRADLPARAKREGIGKMEKEACERLIAFSGFRLGYVRFALGDLPGAKAAFQEHLKDTEALRAKGPIPPEYQVYEGRSRDNLEVLESKIGMPAPAALKDVIWAGSRKLEKGRIAAIVFRTAGDDRSAPFVQALDRFVKTRRDTFDLATITFLRTGESSEDQAAAIMKDAEVLGLDCAVGLDPDAAGKSLFRGFDAAILGGTFVIVDASGNYVWFQQDPTRRDERWAIAILERIAGSAKK
jgi:beta-lactamase regulating signal transducer with metallopeptidase domain/tetratricopeptide (TPR) repeat protein